MKKLEISAGSSLSVIKATNRKERHGKEKVQGITLRVEWWLPSNELLNQLHPGLLDSAYWVPPEEVVQEKIEGLQQVKKHLRVPGMYPQKLAFIEFAGYTFEFEHGIDETTALALYECKVDKFELDAKEGGACSLRFNIGSSQQITPELLGLLCSKEGSEIKLLDMIAPQIKVGDSKPTDNGAPLLDGGSPTGHEAGDKLAENEAAGLNKPASEVPKAKVKRKGAVNKPSLKAPVDEADVAY